MAPNLDVTRRNRIVTLLRAHWRPVAIADEVHCSAKTVYTIERNLQLYNMPSPSNAPRRRGPLRRLSPADEDALLELLNKQPWLYLDEMVEFLKEERDIEQVSVPTVHRVLRARRWSKKAACRTSKNRSEELRAAWRGEMANLRAEQLVCVDEALFKKATGHRMTAWAPIGEPARYRCDLSRGSTWSILPAYTVDGYLDCTAIRPGYFNGEAFFRWVLDELLPCCEPFPGPRSVIVMDNVGIHTMFEESLRREIEYAGCQLRYLPTYSPDYNPVEPTFHILKAWIRRNFGGRFRSIQEQDFGAFLRHAIKDSECDRFGPEHFRSDGYLFEGDIECFREHLKRWDNNVEGGVEEEED